MNATAMTRITISVPESMALRLDAAARATDRSASSIVRFALRRMFEEADVLQELSDITADAKAEFEKLRQR